MNTKILLLLLTLALVLNQGMSQTYVFDFNIDNQLFISGISDFAEIQKQQVEFTFENRNLEFPLDNSLHGQYISGINPSDDLFMYMKRQITGLQPNTSYLVTFVVEFASPYPTNAFGVGGPPGEGVTMKAGLTLIEPDTLVVNKGGPFVIMNIDKGNQSNPGIDMDTIGHVGVNDTTTVWALKTNNNTSHPFTFRTDNTGTGWLIIGTDSGFESKTELFFTKVTASFTIVTSVGDRITPENIVIYPNPGAGIVHITSNAGDIDLIHVYDISGRLYRSYVVKSNEINLNLPPSDYLLKIISGKSKVVKRVVVQ